MIVCLTIYCVICNRNMINHTSHILEIKNIASVRELQHTCVLIVTET